MIFCSGKLLIIEDEAAIQSILSELLTDAGYTVEVAGDGLEGITKFPGSSPFLSSCWTS